MRVKLLGEMRTVGQGFEVSRHYINVIECRGGYCAHVTGPWKGAWSWRSRVYARPRAAARALETELRDMYHALLNLYGNLK